MLLIRVVKVADTSYWLYGKVRSSECERIEEGKKIRVFMSPLSSPHMSEKELKEELYHYLNQVGKSTRFHLEDCWLLPFEYYNFQRE